MQELVWNAEKLRPFFSGVGYPHPRARRGRSLAYCSGAGSNSGRSTNSVWRHVGSGLCSEEPKEEESRKRSRLHRKFDKLPFSLNFEWASTESHIHVSALIEGKGE
jgi:hypothetical protein